jgi:S-adenosylmethionine:tRNA ribosyltransferase-isomerase
VLVDLLDYELPEELIASRPLPDRDGARLLHVPARSPLEERTVRQLATLVPEGSTVVVNDTRVVPARLFATKPTGGRVELLLVERVDTENTGPAAYEQRWRALARSSKPIREGSRLEVGEGLDAVVTAERGADRTDSTIEVRLEARGASVSDLLERLGHVPLPPYMKRDDEPEDRDRYQTVYAREAGAVAAPTAGLHLTPRILDELRARDVTIASVTLHVSLGTFAPVTVADLDAHAMHSESFVVDEAARDAIAAARDKARPVYAIGTTALRALESAACSERRGHVRPARSRTNLLIQPGYDFRVVDGLLTNFHLPRSTLLALVSAFSGRETIMSAYRYAIEQRFRFFSYGDAMLLERRAASESA